MKAVNAILLWGGLAAFLALSPAARAQNDTAVLRSQIDILRTEFGTLQTQFQELQRRVYTGAGGATGAAEAAARASAPSSPESDNISRRLAVVESRVDQIDENKMRQIKGQFDELKNLIQRLDARLGKLVADVDYRLTALEAGPPAASAASVPGSGAAREKANGPSRSGEASALVETDQGYQPSGAPRILGTIPLENGVVEPLAPEPRQSTRAAVLPEGTAEERYKYAFGLLRKARYDEAERVLSAFIETYADHPLAENAAYWRGETFYARKMFGDAARIYATNLQRYPQGVKAPDNMVKLGMALANLERTKEACQAFAELEKKFPDMPANVRQAAKRGRDTARCP